MENKICRKNEILYYNTHLKKLFDVLYQLSVRMHSAKAVSSRFLKGGNNEKEILSQRRLTFPNLLKLEFL